MARYLQELDQADQSEGCVLPAKVTAAELQAKIERAKARQVKDQGYLKQMEEKGQSQLSLTDADSRAMSKGGVAYNVQTGVDSKHHLIVVQEVTNEVTDRDQLSPMALAAKELLPVEQLQAVADSGYAHGKELKTCQEAGIEPDVPRPDTAANTKLGLLGNEQFVYQSATDTDTCPAGQTLSFRFETIEKEGQIRYYKTSACSKCPLQEKCTRHKEGRRITRWVDEYIIEETQVRVEAHPETMKKRGQRVET